MDTMTINTKPTTPEERASWPKTIIVPLEKPFVDERGAIQPLVDVAMESCVLISSKKGTVRANHYHRTDSHFMYVVSGAMKYFHRAAGSSSAPASVVVHAGEMVFTPPMVEHAVEFLEDSVFVNITGKPRDQGTYEDDLVRVELYKPNVKPA